MTIFCNNLAICNHEPDVHYIFIIDEVLYKIVLVEIEGRIVFKDNQIVVAVATESVVFQIFMDGVETLESCIEVYLAVGLDCLEICVAHRVGHRHRRKIGAEHHDVFEPNRIEWLYATLEIAIRIVRNSHRLVFDVIALGVGDCVAVCQNR